MLRKISEQELIDGLRMRKSASIDYLYREYFPLIRHHVKLHSGNEQDAQDIFQDSLVVMFSQIRLKSFHLVCSLKTYFVSIGKNLWLQRLDYKFRLLYQADYVVHEAKEQYHPVDQVSDYESLEMIRLLYKNMLLLPFDCRRLLELYCLRVPFKEIARLMKYKDGVYVKTRKYHCKKLLGRKVMSDPESHQFMEL
mgnify:CR=1 FL=1